MRDEAPEEENHIEEIDDDTKIPVSETILVSAEGEEVASDITPAYPSRPIIQVESEDEEEMLLEV